MAVNKRLMRRTLAFVKANPKKHNQANWCGTAQCFGGWACYLDGWKRDEDTIVIDRCDIALDGPSWGSFNFNPDISDLVRKEHTVGSVLNVATSILGLTAEQARQLFNPDNDVRDLEKLVKRYCR